jgi:hypothetical protein
LLGRYREALSAIDDMRAASKNDQRQWAIEMRAKAEQLRNAILSGPEAAQKLVRENERYSLEKCGLATLLLH